MSSELLRDGVRDWCECASELLKPLVGIILMPGPTPESLISLVRGVGWPWEFLRTLVAAVSFAFEQHWSEGHVDDGDIVSTESVGT